jgi:hypothetical protein
MKTKSGLLAAAFFLAAIPVLVAADKPTRADDKPAVKPAAKAEPAKDDSGWKTVLLTGSYLPQKVTKVGRITDSAQNVTVITHDDLEKSGENNLAAALRKIVPAIH